MMGMNNRQYMDKEMHKKYIRCSIGYTPQGSLASHFDWEIVRKDGEKIMKILFL